MSLVRAFTTRRANKKDIEISSPVLERSKTTKHAFASGTIRNKISAPVELLSTTNMLSYNAPDLYPESCASLTSPSSPPSLVESSSSSTRSSSEQSMSVPPATPETDVALSTPNHLSCYFEKRTSTNNEDPYAPQIPQRSPSHTKRNHEILHRKRSVSRVSQRSLERSNSVKNSVSSFARDSIQMFSSTPELVEDDASMTSFSSAPSIGLPSTPSPAPIHSKKASHSHHHPFGAELAQVTELAEEYSHVTKDSSTQDGLDNTVDSVHIVEDSEEQALLIRGLFRFDASDYMREIEPLYLSAFEDTMRTQLWI